MGCKGLAMREALAGGQSCGDFKSHNMANSGILMPYGTCQADPFSNYTLRGPGKTPRAINRRKSTPVGVFFPLGCVYR